MDILQWAALFVISLTVVLKSAEFFTESAEKIGVHFKISPFVIGVTIVAFGTSLPEIVTSISSVIQGHSEIVIGNVAGSNIANILLVLGATAIAGKHIVVNKDIINIDLPIILGSTILLFIMTLDQQITYVDGIILLLGLITYIVYNVKSQRPLAEKESKDVTKLKKQQIAKLKKRSTPLKLKHPLILLISGTFLYFSAEFTILSVVRISEILQVATDLIAVSAIAIGTSLPELVVSIAAARKGKVDMAVGNVMGSNIFNALGVVGASSLVGVLEVSNQMISFTIPALVLVTVLYVFTTMDKQISQWEGVTLLLLYVAFIGKIFGLV